MNQRKMLVQHAKFNSYKIEEEAMDSFLGQVAKDHSIIMFGVGAHHSQESYNILIKCIKYLNKFGYKDIFVEFPHSFSWFYNKYLQTGDLHYYRIVGDEGNFFRELHEFNAKLHPSEKISVWGIDVDHFNHTVIYQIEEYLKKISDTRLKEKALTILSPFWMQNKEMNIHIMETLENIFEEYKERLIKETNERDFERIHELIKYNKLSSKVLKDGSDELREEFLKKGL